MKPPVSIDQLKAKREDAVVIAHISDLHFKAGTSRGDATWNALREDLRRNDVIVDVLAVTGDLIDSSVYDNFKEEGVGRELQNVKKFLLEDLCPDIRIDPQLAMLVVPGNHDFRLTGLFWKDAQYDLFYKEFQDYFGAKLYPQLKLCFFTFDSNTPDRALNFATGLVDKNDLVNHHAQVEKITKEYADFWNASTRVVLIHHHPMPIAPTEHRDQLAAGEEFMLLKNAAQFMEQMVASKMDLVLHGHRHYPAFSRVSFPTSEGGNHEIAIVAAGSVGKKDDHDYSYNLVTVSGSGELTLERRVLRVATYQREALVPISDYESARYKRSGRPVGDNRRRIRADKYVRVDAIRAGSGDAVIEENFYNTQSMGAPISTMSRTLTSQSGIFGTWTYEAPPGQTIEWKWDGPPRGNERDGTTTLSPPLGKNPLTFSRRGITFNAIHFNQRDRLDTTDKKFKSEWTTMSTSNLYDSAVLQVSFPPSAFPSDFRVEVHRPDNKTRDYQEEEFLHARLTKFPSSCSVILVLPRPLPDYYYRIVWELPENDLAELNLSAQEKGLAIEIVQRLLELRKPDSNHIASVEDAMSKLRQEILAVPAYASKTKDDQLEVELCVYDENKGGLVCAASLSSHPGHRQALQDWIVKPGRYVVGQAFRRREGVLLVNVPGIQSELASFYEPIPGLEDLPRHTVIFSIPLFYPVRGGSKVGALSLASRSNTSGLLCMHKDKAAVLALKEQVVVWYATQLASALGLPNLL
jgi:3',5'-cyclic AMP phosphodiesterase CpdA